MACMLWLQAGGAFAQQLPYRLLPVVQTLPTDELRSLFMDRQGLLWLGTSAGLKRYDGYDMQVYKANDLTPGILPNNNVLSMTEDHDQNLWLGTGNGLVKMDKQTGRFKTYMLPLDNQHIIYCLYTSPDGTVWVGTDGGLSSYDSKTDRFVTYRNSNTPMFGPDGRRVNYDDYSVKSILDDGRGNIFVGTWRDGLLRLDRRRRVIYSYTQLNDRNSAHSLFFDRSHRLWVGTWSRGMMRLDRPYDQRDPEVKRYPYVARHFDTYYKIVEDTASHTLWACSREGVSVLSLDDPQATWRNYTMAGQTSLNFSNDILAPGYGDIWIVTASNGIVHASTRQPMFDNIEIEGHDEQSVSAVLSLYTTDGRYFWLGLNPYGLAFYDRQTGRTLYGRQISGFAAVSQEVMGSKIPAIVHRRNGELWFANSSYGIIVRRPDGSAHMLDHTTAPYIPDDYVCTLYEDRRGCMWVGMREGISVVTPEGRGQMLRPRVGRHQLPPLDVRGICQDHEGTVWVATDNSGIVAVKGDPRRPATLSFEVFDCGNGGLPVSDATTCFEDSRRRLWAISSSGGLFRYEKAGNRFVPVNRSYHIPGERAFAITEDRGGHLWITTEEALVRLSTGHDGETEVVSFTHNDGIDDMLFSPNAVAGYEGELYFGNRMGFIAFDPQRWNNTMAQRRRVPLVVTDILVDDEPIARLDSSLRARVSATMPSYTRRITVPDGVRKVGVEVALLSYNNVGQARYAFRLDGYDREWVYTDRRRAEYQNLPAGTYRLQVRASSSQGVWQELPYDITLRILPPWYATWWARLLWTLLLAGAVWMGFRWYRNHLKTRNRLQMAVVFTNITHDLLTPLTVISASVDEMRNVAPQMARYYQIIQQNVGQITRMLRQILEVRKAQAGQLKLLVARGDLAAFVSQICNNLRPMAHLRHNPFSVEVPEEGLSAWFDADKVDKILANLLSNAFKYNREEGKVSVVLRRDGARAIITVSDEGIGMAPDRLKHLYTRFLDGDYRRMGTAGTGIGLSLVRDLVTLHHGTIACQSQEGRGTIFTVSLPIDREAYPPHEIDTAPEGTPKPLAQAEHEVVVGPDEGLPEPAPTDDADPDTPDERYKILLVEDNEQLLSIMVDLLGRSYRVTTARNGQQAWNAIQREELDVVVSDVKMPVMDGIALTRLIKESDGYAQLPVILLTAKTGEADRDEGYRTGADDYITKPFRLDELRLHIDTMVANRRRVAERFRRQIEATTPTTTTAPATVSSPDQLFVERAMACVREHLSDVDYDRDRFARDMAVSASTLYNKLRAATGLSITEFVNTMRLQEAMRLLRQDPDLPVAEIAARVGYNTPKYFSRLFKKQFGMLPSEVGAGTVG